MAIKKVKLPNNTTLDIHDARVVSDAITYIGAQQGSATYVDGGTIIDVTTKADKATGATSGNFAGLDSSGNLTDSGHKHSDYQVALVSGTNIKTINNQSLLGSGNITIQGGSGGSGTVTSVAMTVPTGLSVSGSPITTEGTLAVSLASGYSIPTTTKQSQWDAKGTYSKPSGGIPATDLASAVQTSLGKADTALQSYTETDPTVPSWAKASSKPTYTASEVGALPDTTVVPTESTVSGWGFTKNAGTITGITMNGSSKGTSGVVNLGTVVTSESDPVFTASAAHGISSTDISNWNAKQKAITVSSSAPTSSQGSNGDIWIVI